MTKDQLLDTFQDANWRTAVFETSRLVDFLKESILCEKYKIPDAVASIVHLTDHGNRVMQRLITKNEVPPREARLLCLLRMFHLEPLVDFTRTDVEDLRSMIDEQIRDRSLLFPFILGRDLYDRAGELFEDARDVLAYRDTLKLVADMPIGVFQFGPFVSGPFGLVRAGENRWLAPTTLVPMYHCSDLTCGAVHRTRLSTDVSAPINEHQATLDRVLDQIGEDESEWSEFVDALGELEGLRYDDRSEDPITLALADLFGDAELRVLLAELLDTTDGRARNALSPFGISGKGDEAVGALERAEVIQCLLIAGTNNDLVAAIDQLIARRDSGIEGQRSIRVPDGEIRRLRTNQRMSYGTFGIFPEVSRYGIRFISRDVQLAPMRLARLAESLFILDEHEEVDELQWQLRDIEGEEPVEQLEEFLRSTPPEESVRRLVLARRTNQILASQHLGLAYETFTDDDDFVAAIMWKLGFYNRQLEDRNGIFWNHHGRLKRFAQTAGVGARVDAEDLRSRAVNYFVELEGVLDDSLAYATWALTTDHIASGQPFTYNVERDRLPSFALLNQAARDLEHESEIPALSEANTLYPLIRGFGTLAMLIKSYASSPERLARTEWDFPRYVHFTDLKKFPFRHTAPVMDLVEKSRSRIIESLEFVSQVLDAGGVPHIRNDYMHYRSANDLPRLDASLEAAEKAVSRLESDGLCRLSYSLVSDEGDGWGRRVYTLENARMRQLNFMRPSAYDWNRMPPLYSPQYVVPAAIYARPNEMLRFSPAFNTDYASYWDEYPSRRRRRDAAATSARLPAASE